MSTNAIVPLVLLHSRWPSARIRRRKYRLRRNRSARLEMEKTWRDKRQRQTLGILAQLYVSSCARSDLQILIDHLQDPLGHGGEIEYKTMAWWHVGILMIAETVSLGVLSLPSAVATMGLLPGLVVISSFGLLATYSGYVIWQFRMKHPHVLSFSDAGQILFGAFGRELFALASQAQLVCFMASHSLTFSIMMNVLTDHGTCTIAFGCLGFVLSLLLTLPRKLQNIAYISIACKCSQSSIMERRGTLIRW